jgi:hypothetical protein
VTTVTAHALPVHRPSALAASVAVLPVIAIAVKHASTCQKAMAITCAVTVAPVATTAASVVGKDELDDDLCQACAEQKEAEQTEEAETTQEVSHS